MKLKKLMPLANIVAISVPTVAAVSCGGKNLKTHDENSPFIVNGQMYSVQEDGIYFTKDSYNGKLWNNDTKDYGHEISEPISKLDPALKMDDQPLRPQVEMGYKDSFYVLFNDDDNDGLSINDFEKELFFSDSVNTNSNTTSAVFEGFDTLNKAWGNTFVRKISDVSGVSISEINASGIMTPFIDGKTAKWIDSVGFNGAEDTTGATGIVMEGAHGIDWINKLTNITEDERQQLLAMYQNANSTAGKRLLKTRPWVWDEGVFTAKKVASNAMKITFNFDEDAPNPIGWLNKKPSISMAGFYLKNSLSGELSTYPTILSKSDIGIIERESVYTYFARKI